MSLIYKTNATALSNDSKNDSGHFNDILSPQVTQHQSQLQLKYTNGRQTFKLNVGNFILASYKAPRNENVLTFEAVNIRWDSIKNISIFLVKGIVFN